MSGPLNQLGPELPPAAPVRSRRPRIRTRGGALLVAAISTTVVFTVLGLIIVNAPGWERVQAAFFDWDNFAESAPGIIGKFWVNVAIFLTAEALILVLGLLLAVMRGLPGPVLFPLRLMATIYVDLFRALPGVLVIFILGFGIPGLRLPACPTTRCSGASSRSCSSIGATYRRCTAPASTPSTPARRAAARSLGLSHGQALRFVVCRRPSAA